MSKSFEPTAGLWGVPPGSHTHCGAGPVPAVGEVEIRSLCSNCQGLRIVAPVVGNIVIAEKITAAADRVVEGATLSEALRVHPEIPGTLIQMVAVGEDSGTLGDMLARAADAMDEEIEARLSRLLSLLEPLIILVMGAVVAFIVVSVLLPLLDISNIVQ